MTLRTVVLVITVTGQAFPMGCLPNAVIGGGPARPPFTGAGSRRATRLLRDGGFLGAAGTGGFRTRSDRLPCGVVQYGGTVRDRPAAVNALSACSPDAFAERRAPIRASWSSRGCQPYPDVPYAIFERRTGQSGGSIKHRGAVHERPGSPSTAPSAGGTDSAPVARLRSTSTARASAAALR